MNDYITILLFEENRLFFRNRIYLLFDTPQSSIKLSNYPGLNLTTLFEVTSWDHLSGKDGVSYTSIKKGDKVILTEIETEFNAIKNGQQSVDTEDVFVVDRCIILTDPLTYTTVCLVVFEDFQDALILNSKFPPIEHSFGLSKETAENNESVLNFFSDQNKKKHWFDIQIESNVVDHTLVKLTTFSDVR